MQSLVPQQVHTGTASTETINGWMGIDLIDGAGGNDTLNGNEGNDLLIGNDGNDILNGHAGTDLLQGGAGDDQLNDATGAGLFDGGAGNDSLAGSSAANFFAGGSGNDSISSGSGMDIIAFNRGDGADTVAYSTGLDNTLSIGGGIGYEDLSLRRSGNDLIVDAGSGDQITFQSWYSSTQNRSVLNLQVVAEAMTGFSPGGANTLLDQKVETFNFSGLVTRFDQARAADPALTSWSMMSALLDFHTGGSDTAALGGDLAHEYGLNRSLTGVGYGAAQTVMNDSTFGVTAQALNSAAAVYAGQVRLT
jgi:Ca2+-binding RTX toxin-like protein